MATPGVAQEHEKWMRVCLQLAAQALQTGNPPVGALVVKEGLIAGRGTEATRTKGDITCHAEIEAVRDALSTGKFGDLSGCTLYTTHEPCLMCSYVIRHYKVSQVVMGTIVPAVGGYSSAYPLLTASDVAPWSPPPHCVRGVLAEACQALTLEYEQQNKR